MTTLQDVFGLDREKNPRSYVVRAVETDLVKALELKLSDHAGAVSFASANFCEVEVKAGQAVLTTRIGAWLAKIDEACP